MSRSCQTAFPAATLRRCAVIGVAAALAALSSCAEKPSDEPAYTPKPQPPYSSDEFASTRLILRFDAGRFDVVSSTPSFGNVTEAGIDVAIPDVLEGRKALYSYAARNLAGDLLAQGYFTVPTTARATFTEADDSGRIHHVELDDPSLVVRVAIPFAQELATIEFQTLVPDKDRRYETWTREDAGTVRLDPGTVEQRGKEESS